MEQRLIDAEKLREKIETIPFSTNDNILLDIVGMFRDKILRIIDEQPTVASPFKAIASINIGEDQLRKVCKEQLVKMMEEHPMPLQTDAEAELNRWIPVKEKLPKKGKNVLISKGNVEIAYLTDIFGFPNNLGWSTETCYYQIEKVKAWRPLPEPYREE